MVQSDVPQINEGVNAGDLVAGRYRLLRPIGAGAMGTVWAARHELLGRDFALKLATLSARAGPEARARFLREAQIVGKLRHPNVVDVADVGDVGTGAGLYLAMELLEGKSLAQRIADHGPIDPPEALAIVSEVCRGLGAAHAAGVIHRDIKPENIFLSRGPSGGIVPKLLDFGISKAREAAPGLVTHSGQLFGTPAYMSPEQALGETDIDHRTDVWSLGVVLYEMITGKRPFEAESYPGLLLLIAERDPTPLPPSVPLAVQAIISRCLAKDREDRYPTADALRAALDAARGRPATQSVRPDKVEPARALPSYRPGPPPDPGRTRKRMALLFGGIVLAMAAAGGVWRLSHRGRASVAPPIDTPAPTAATPPASAVAVTAAPPATAPPIDTAAPSATANASARPLTSAIVRPKATTAPSSGKSVTKVNNAGF